MGLLTPQAMEYLGLLGQSMLGGQSPNAGVNISNAMMFADQDMRKQALLKQREEEEKQQRQMRDMQMQRMMQAQKAEEYMGRGVQQFMRPPQAPSQSFAPGDMETPSQMNPGSPGGFDQGGFAQYLAQNPATAQQALQYMPQQKGPEFKVVGNRLAKIENGNVSEAMGAPQETIKKGTTRVIESGRVKFTYEWDGSGWKQIAKSAVDKPAALGEAGPAGLGKAPQGYRWNQDGSALEPIPGGPADAKVGKEAQAMKKRESGALARADLVLSRVGEAINKTGVTTAGPVGAVMRNIPGSGAYDLEKTLDAVRSNIGFAELQAMREASPTGGALGQVAVQELNMLQSVLGSLDTAQSPAQLEKSLYAIEKHFKNWKRTVEQANRGGNQETTAPQAGTVDGGYVFMGGDPADKKNWKPKK